MISQIVKNFTICTEGTCKNISGKEIHVIELNSKMSCCLKIFLNDKKRELFYSSARISL